MIALFQSAFFRSSFAVVALPVICASAFLLLPFVHVLAEGHPPAEEADPIPIERVPLDAERLSSEMERVRRGVLVQLPRAEFEEKVRQAARATTLAKNPPQLVEARYRARLVENDLVGSAQWKVVHTGPTPALLPLEFLNLAVRQPRFENREALLGELDGKNLSLLVDESGTRSVALDWTAMGKVGPDGLRFYLEIPACAVAVLELDLPADYGLKVETAGCLLTGPTRAEDEGHRLWKIGFAGRTRLHFTVRREDQAGASRVVLSKLKTRQELHPDFLRAEYQFELKVTRGGTRELLFEYDPSLQPYEVVVPELESWELCPGVASTAPGLLAVHLRKPLEEDKLEIRCLAPVGRNVGGRRPGAVYWTSPGIRLPRSIAQGETLELQLLPDVRLEDWQANGFRLTRSLAREDGSHILFLNAESPDPDRVDPIKNTGPSQNDSLASLMVDQFLVGKLALGWLEGLFPHSPLVIRPSAWLATSGTEFRVRTMLWWQADPEQPLLTARVQYDLIHGRLFELPLSFPPDWAVDRVDLQPARLLSEWREHTDEPWPLLIVPLKQALKAADSINEPGAGDTVQSAQLTVVLRPKTLRRGPPTVTPRPEGLTWAFPQVVVPGARWSEDHLAISWDEQVYQGSVSPDQPSTLPPDEGPWGNDTPDYYCALSGTDARSKLHLEPLPAQLTAECRSEVLLAAGHVTVDAHLRIFVESGTVDVVDVLTSAPLAGKVTWKTEPGSPEVGDCERLPAREASSAAVVLSATTLFQAIGVCAVQQPGQWWRVHLAHPLSPRQPLLLEYTCEASDGEDESCSVPLPLVSSARRTDGEVTLHLAGVERLQIEARGLREPHTSLFPVSRTRAAFLWRTFQYDAAPVGLTLRGPIPAASWTTETETARTELTTSLLAEGLLQQFRFDVQHWRQRTISLRLPADAQLLAVRVAGGWLSLLPEPVLANPGGNAEALSVDLPVPGSEESSRATPIPYEVIYLQHAPAWTFWERLQTVAPVLPIEPTSSRQLWRLPPGVSPLPDGRWNRLPSLSARPGIRGEGTDLDSRASIEKGRSGHEDSPGPTCCVYFDDKQGWTEWEPIAGLGTQGEMLVVRRLPLSAAGVALCIVPALTWWFMRRRSTRRRLALLCGWLAISGLTLLWLPGALRPLAEWAWLTGAAVAFGWHLRFTFRSAAARASIRSPARSAVKAASVLFLCGVLGIAVAAGPTTHPAATVFLVPVPDGAADKQTVLAPAELLEQLETLAHPSSEVPRGVSLLSAVYEGTVREPGVDFELLLQAYAFEDHPAPLLLPLAGIQLQEDNWLDGARAYPSAVAKTGYSLKIEGKGTHTLRLRFRVMVQTTADDCDVQFAIPRLVQSQCTLHLPAGATQAQILSRLGGQTVKTDPQGVQVTASLGRGNAALQIHWRQETGPPGPLALQVREAYLWTVRPLSSTVTALLQYTATHGAVGTLTLDLPDGLEVLSIESAVLTPGTSAPRLSDWHVDSTGQRRLTVDFVNAQTTILLRLELALRQPQGASLISLPVLTPLAAQPIQSLLAFRLEGVEVSDKKPAHLTGVQPDEFLSVWKALAREDLSPPAGAYTLTRTPDGAPLLGLLLQAPAAIEQAVQEVAWQVGPNQTDVQLRARLTPAEGTLALVEWQVPPTVFVGRVRGPAVWYWSRSGSRLQVWLHPTPGPVEVDVTGWIPLGEGSPGVEKVSTPPSSVRPPQWELPVLRLLEARSQTTFLHLTASPGLVLTTTQERNLTRLPSPGQPERDRYYLAQQADYAVNLEVRPAAPQTQTRVLTRAEFRDRRLILVHTVNVRVQGELHSLEVRLDDWDGDEVRLEANRLARRREQRLGPASRSWDLDLQPGVTGSYQFQVTVATPLERAQAGLPIPVPRVVGSESLERWIVLEGPEWTLEAPAGLEPVREATPEAEVFRHAWPSEAAQVRHAGGAVWHGASTDSPVLPRLLIRPRTAAPARVQVLSNEQAAAVADGRRWLHHATYWLFHEANTDVSMQLPPRATLLSVTLDGIAVTSFRPDAERLWLPLPGEAGAALVQLRWRCDAVNEGLEHPCLERPTLEGVLDPTAIWTVQVPEGYRVAEDQKWNTPGFLSPVARTLRRAEAQMRLSAALVQSAPGGSPSQAVQLSAAQRRFYRLVRLAEQELSPSDPEAAETKERLRELRERNREQGRTLGFEKTCEEAERLSRQEPPIDTIHSADAGLIEDLEPGRGAPFIWESHSGEGGTPELTLSPVRTRQVSQALWGSALLIALLSLVWLLSFFPRAIDRLSRFWPEQIALLAFPGWWLGAPVPVLLGFVLLGAVARTILLVRREKRLRTQPVSNSPASGN
jgi:hypothetical protein